METCCQKFYFLTAKFDDKIAFADKLLDSMPETAIRQMAAQFLEQSHGQSSGFGLPNGGITIKDSLPPSPSPFAVPHPHPSSTPHKGRKL